MESTTRSTFHNERATMMERFTTASTPKTMARPTEKDNAHFSCVDPSLASTSTHMITSEESQIYTLCCVLPRQAER